MSPEEAAALFQKGSQLLPAWNAPPDPDRQAEARAVIEAAAHEGHVPAMDFLSIDGDPMVAFEWACRTARKGHMSDLVSSLTSGDWPAETSILVWNAAHAEESWAQVVIGCVYRLGMQYEDGVLVATEANAYGWLPGVPDPDAEGLKWLERAALSGWPPALLWLAIALQTDDSLRALELITRAAGSYTTVIETVQASVRVVHMDLLERASAPLDQQIAAFRTYADGGDMDAMTWMADRYRLGEGLQQDLIVARSLYVAAAEKGQLAACRELGLMFESGLGGPMDRERARHFFEQAAELGADPVARQRLVEGFGLDWYAPGPDE